MCLKNALAKCRKIFRTPCTILIAPLVAVIAVLLMKIFVTRFSWDSISSLGTMLLAITSFYTVREMGKSREQALKPDLIILKPNESYTFRWIPNETLQPITRPKLSNNQPDQCGTRMPIFRLKNIGNGPAKKIEIVWNLTGDSINSIVESSEILKKYNPSIQQGILYISNTTVRYDLSFENKMSITHDYCISSPSNDFIEIIKMPSWIMAGLEIQLIALPRPNQFGPVKLAEIEVNLKYLDTNGKIHDQVFFIDPRLTYIPDNFGSADIPIDAIHHSADNIRGHITFLVNERSTTDSLTET